MPIKRPTIMIMIMRTIMIMGTITITSMTMTMATNTGTAMITVTTTPTATRTITTAPIRNIRTGRASGIRRSCDPEGRNGARLHQGSGGDLSPVLRRDRGGGGALVAAALA